MDTKGKMWEGQIGRLRLTYTVVVLQLSCVQLCDCVDCSLSGSSVHGISQARVLEWVTISFSRGCS